MAKIGLEKVLIALLDSPFNKQFDDKVKDALKEQGLEYKDGEIVEVQKLKFKVGAWVVWQNKCYKVNYNGCGYELIDQNDLSTSLEYGTVDESAHLWTIQDAKNGDVLVVPHIEGSEHSEQIFIFKEIKDREYAKNAVEYYCRYLDGEFRTNERGFMGQADDYFTPATKEQRDILFAKMEEAGYGWNAEMKELKKIEPIDTYEGLTDFERTVADICIGWIGKELGWKEYIKDNADVLLKIAAKKFNKDFAPVYDYEHANIQQKDFAPKATTANRQLYNRAILKLLSDYVEKYPDIRFGQMLCNLDVNPHFDEESKETYWNLCKTINKQNHE